MSDQPSAPLDDAEPDPDDLNVARLAYEMPRDEYHQIEQYRDRALAQLTTTRVIAGAMATLFGGAIFIAGEPLGSVLQRPEVSASVGATIALLALTLIASVGPYLLLHWQDGPSRANFLAAEADTAYPDLLWEIGDQFATASERNRRTLAKLELAVNLATILALLSSLALLLAAVLAVLAVQQAAAG